MNRISFLAIPAFLSGCAGLGQVERITDLSSSELRQLQQVKIYESDAGLKYSDLGKVKGISCKGSAFSGDTKEEAAKMQLKIKAMKSGADGIVFLTCSHDASVDWGNNCWESWVCVGQAIRVER